MIAAAAALFGASFTVAACYSLGSVIAARCGAKLERLEKFPLAFGLGAAILHLAIFVILALKVGYWPVFVLLLAAAVASGLWTGDWRLPAASKPAVPNARQSWKKRFVRWLFGLIIAVFTLIYFVNAWAPELSPDGAGYHLGLVARYLRVHGFEAVPTNFYSGLSQGAEMLYVAAFAIGRHSAAALVHFSFTIALALAIHAYGCRIGKELVGMTATLLVYLSPVVAVVGTSAYVDVAAAAAVFLAFYWAEIWDLQQDSRLLIPLGLMCGYCYAVKYTAGVMLLYAVGFVLWRKRTIRLLPAMLASALLMAAPWAIKNWIYLQNPVAPLANRIFRNPFMYVEIERRWTTYLRSYGITNWWSLPFEDTVRGVTGGVLGPVFLIAPLALLAMRQRTGRRLLLVGALLMTTYYGNIGTRFLIPPLPFVSLAIGLALDSAPLLMVLLVTLHAILSLPPVLHLYSAAWSIQPVFPLRAALRIESQDQYFSLNEGYQLARMIERYVPPGERVLVFQGLPIAYTSREVLRDYEGAFNSDVADISSIPWDEKSQPHRLLRFSFTQRRLRRIRIVQTAMALNPFEQWSVHELRFFSSGSELPRSPAWGTHAFPNPWDISMAFDGSLVTRWRSWETLAPGMYIEVDFGREQTLDEVAVVLSDDEPDVKLQLQEVDAKGRTQSIPARREEQRFAASNAFHREAVLQLHTRHLDYLLVRDDDGGASDYSQTTQWGMTMLAHENHAALYKINP